MKHAQRKQNITNLAVLVVFTVFAACVLLVLLAGADLYRNLTERDQRSYDRRTAAQYITTRVRQNDCAGEISVTDFHGVSALVLHQEIGQERYETRIYCCEGYIRELFAAAGSDLLPEDGEKLMEADSLAFHLKGAFLSVEITHIDDTTQSLALFLRSGEGAAP